VQKIEFFCTLCSCTKEKLVTYNVGDARCDRCKRRSKRKCYHHRVCDEVQVSALLAELEAELGEYHNHCGKQFDEVAKKSKIKTDHMIANRYNDINHIDFVILPNNDEAKKQYTQFISRECHICGIPLHGSHLEDWHANLRTCLLMENRIKFLREVQRWSEMGRKTVPLVEVAELLIPCVLHLENRADEKILTCILRYGFNLFVGISSGEQCAKSYICSIEEIIQRQVLGTEVSPSQWKLKWSKTADGIKIDNVQLRNQVARKMLHHCDKIIEAALMDDDIL
jgi:hypothetical protein